MDERRTRAILAAAAVAFGLSSSAAAIVPGAAWRQGSTALAAAPELGAGRVLDGETGLTVTRLEGGAVDVTTGDGGGAGTVLGLDAGRLRARAVTAGVFEIGTEPGRPSVLVDRSGVRLEDGMLDRLRARMLPEPALLALAALVLLVLRSRARRPVPAWLAPALLALAAFVLARRTG